VWIVNAWRFGDAFRRKPGYHFASSLTASATLCRACARVFSIERVVIRGGIVNAWRFGDAFAAPALDCSIIDSDFEMYGLRL